MSSLFESIKEFIVEFLSENFGGFTSSVLWGNPLAFESVDSICWISIRSWMLLFGLMLLAILALLFFKPKYVDKLSKHISWLSITVWLLGVVVYIIGFYDVGINGVSVVLRAIIASFKMFVVSDELSRVSPVLQHDAAYMALFSLLHFIAAFITFLFIFRMLGYKIKSSLKIFYRRWICRGTNGRVMHLFWGVNEASCLMAESIKRHNDKYHKNEVIIFIDVDEDNEDYVQRKTNLGDLSNTITISKNEMVRLDAVDALVDHCYNGPAAFNSDKPVDIFGILGLKNIRAIIKRSSKLHIYFLSENENKNVSGALNLQNDITLSSLHENKNVIYVHARRSANNEVLDHYAQYEKKPENVGTENIQDKEGLNKTDIKIIDSAYLSIAALKLDDRALPVNSVDVNKETGTVDSPFTSMVVGFGGTGQEAFRFLYEFSAFVNSNGDKTPFMCYAVDAKIDEIEGFVRKKMPAITCEELSLVNASIDSAEFWGRVESIINKLNYVVVTLNNDALGLSFAVNLFKYALMHREKNLPMLKIMVRCYETSNEKRMDEVSRELNKSVEGRNIEMQIFGTKQSIYSRKTIISDAILVEAKEFHWVYKKKAEVTADAQWKKDFIEDNGVTAIDSLIEKKREDEGIIMSRYHAIQDINRRIAQNISNARHSRTKMILMGFDEKDLSERLKLYYGYVDSRKYGTLDYDCNALDATLLKNMAIVEHERWIASHKLMGYTYAPENDHEKKHHKYLVPWKDLNTEEQSWDCDVVDTTIRFAYENSKKIN
ncbi:MAG: hypothetical protein IKM69_02420 [Alistipes sp.]|nr:hypothetical protein [Alistipes sp.]